MPMAEYNENQYCTYCGTCMTKLLSMPMVMNHALHDGTRRFDGIRAQREIEREQKAKLREQTVGLIKKNIDQERNTCS